MMNLAEYRKKSAQLADFLPWAALVAPGVVLNKDGSFQRTARFRGPDLDSATPAELVGTTARLNNALRRLGSGWALFVEAQRHPATDYPESLFPDPPPRCSTSSAASNSRIRRPVRVELFPHLCLAAAG
jgi:type IV secretion system protein VirB4